MLLQGFTIVMMQTFGDFDMVKDIRREGRGGGSGSNKPMLLNANVVVGDIFFDGEGECWWVAPSAAPTTSKTWETMHTTKGSSSMHALSATLH